VDDWLDAGGQVAVHWTLNQMNLLRQLLEAAREAGRAVVMTSDHGYVVDQDMQYRASEEPGERHREQGAAPAAGECQVAGARVLTPGGRVVLPWSEKIRYGGNKLGYHGGGTLQEVVIPLGVFLGAADQEVPAGWQEVARAYPHWWQLAPEPPGVREGPGAPRAIAPVGRKGRADPPSIGDLFEAVPATAPAEDWVAPLLGSAVLNQQKGRFGRVPIRDEQLTALLRILAQYGGQLAATRLAQELRLPRARLGGFLAGVKRLLNLDGYPVLSEDRDSGTVSLNVELLKTQFEL
jgi:hypothetical protein